MRAVFLADAHLRNPGDANYQALLQFLGEQEGHTDLLGLLGDICEFLVGYPDSVFPAYRPLFDALRRLQQGGTRLVYVEGNHDFTSLPTWTATSPANSSPTAASSTLTAAASSSPTATWPIRPTTATAGCAPYCAAYRCVC